MPDIDKWEFGFPCPICELESTVTLQQVRYEEYFICRGCYSTIKVTDQLGGVQRLKQSMQGILK